MGFGNMQQMMKQVQKMQRDMQRVQEELKEREVEGQAGGGVVQVTLTCGFDVKAVAIKPEAIDPSDPDFLAELVRQAMQSALDRVQEVTQSEMGKVTGGMRLPGM
jgi:hypothetical protein